MSHQVDSMVYVDQKNLAKTGVPWHGLGKAKTDGGWLTDAEAIEEIGFDVVTRPLYRMNYDGEFVKLDDAQETVRVDNGKHIAVVGSEYVPYPGDRLIKLGSRLVDDWGAKWDTAATINNNRLIFATLRLDVVSQEGRGLAELDDSDYFTWLLLSSSHDGSTGICGDVVSVRTVCKNTFNLGRAGAKSSWSIKHVGDVDRVAEEAHRTMGLVTKREKEFQEFAVKLAEVDFQIEEFEKMVETLVPVKSSDTDRIKRNRNEAREGMKANWLNTTTISDDLRFTGWGALNGVTEWAEHVRPVRNSKVRSPEERRMLSTCFGGPIQRIRENTQAYLSHKVSA